MHTTINLFTLFVLSSVLDISRASVSCRFLQTCELWAHFWVYQIGTSVNSLDLIARGRGSPLKHHHMQSLDPIASADFVARCSSSRSLSSNYVSQRPAIASCVRGTGSIMVSGSCALVANLSSLASKASALWTSSFGDERPPSSFPWNDAWGTIFREFISIPLPKEVIYRCMAGLLGSLARP